MNQTIADDVFEAMEKFGIDRMNVDFRDNRFAHFHSISFLQHPKFSRLRKSR